MAVNYSDDRLVAVEKAENKATTEINKTYNDMIESSDKVYKEQISASKDWVDKQVALQKEQTDFAIDKIEQQKAQAEKDYIKEQSGAYVDWQKESNRYGANAEQMASQGFVGSGYGESSQVSMYNTYQNRVAVARETHSRAMMNLDNGIREAKLQNSSALAEIYLKAYEQQAQLSIQMVTNRNQLLAEKLNAKTQTHQIYRNQYQDVLEQINKEKQREIEKAQFDREMSLAEAQFKWKKEQASKFSSGGSASVDKPSGGSRNGNTTTFSGTAKYDNKSNSGAPTKDAAKYGTFSNGYQPKGIGDYGKVSKTGNKVVVNGKTQNLWKTNDGTLWYWDGSVRAYKKTSLPSVKGGAMAGGIMSRYIK